MSASLVERHIVAMGGGGFSMEPDNPLLDQYILGLVNKAQPKVCFLPTAGGDSDSYIVKFYSAFLKFSCQPSHLSLFNLQILDLRGFLLEQDIIYVGGGNTKNLVALWREWELDRFLKEAWERGTILCGLSAGSFDGVGLHFINGTLAKIVSSRPHAKAYCVERQDGVVQETVLEPTYLGA